MTAHDEQLYSDIDDLLIFSGGYLLALKQQSKNDKLVKMTEKTIQKISDRYKNKIEELYNPTERHPDSLKLKG